jgi:hypothetical protein
MATTLQALPKLGLETYRWLGYAPVGLALTLWATSLPAVDLDAMNDLGLNSVLPATYWIGLSVVLISTVAGIHHEAAGRVIVAHLAALVAMIHATPSVLYHSLRYSWSWKHIGIVDYIIHHHAVDPHGTDPLTVYHSWPGFFALNAVQVGAAGVSSALAYASWAEPVFGLLVLGPLWLIFDTLCPDRRRVWFGLLLFELGNWVGQDYFAPQALCFLLHLVVLVACLRWLPDASPQARKAILAVVVLLLFAIVSSHQLTPLMTLATLLALVVFRKLRQWWLPLLLAAMIAAWVWLMATTFFTHNLYWIIESVGRPSSNADTFIDTSRLTWQGRLVTYGDRALTGGLVLLAGLGWLVMTRRRQRRLTLSLLAAAPFPLLLANNYGGEMLCRVFLFALPFLALLSTAVVFPSPRQASASGLFSRSLVMVVVIALLFCTAYYGKERAHYFDPEEVSASNWLYAHAPDGAVIVAANAQLPWAYTHYWTYTHHFLSDLPLDLRRQLDQRPELALEEAVGDQRPAYVIFGTTQTIASSYLGDLPVDGIEAVEQTLRQDPGVELVFRNRDAAIYRIGAGVRV